MKERLSFTFDKKTVELINELVKDNSYRNKSHLVEKAILSLGKKKDGEKDES